MARPLKHWLYKHRDNPYPTKTEKVLLALGSHMTLVQVRNDTSHLGLTSSFQVLQQSAVRTGFQLVCQCPATAEEHSETAGPQLGVEDQTVQQLHPGKRRASERVQRRHRHRRYELTIRTLLKLRAFSLLLYFCILMLSMSFAADEECHLQTPISQSQYSRSSHVGVLQKQGGVLAGGDDGTSPPSKYKSSLLNRYLNDTLRHMMAAEAQGTAPACKRRSHFESFSSMEGDQDAASPASSYEIEANFVNQKGERCHWFSLYLMWKFPALLITNLCLACSDMTL